MSQKAFNRLDQNIIFTTDVTVKGRNLYQWSNFPESDVNVS